MDHPVRVLHVDDDPSFTELAATFLEREDDRFRVETATRPSDGLEYLASHDVDCVVSDYDMPGQNGIEFLEAVREERNELPFILFTGKGSEEIASEAIVAGVTDYLRKESGTERYELLANRIRNAVEKYRATRRAANLDRLRNLSSDVNQALIRATSRTEIESSVCEIFSAADPYLFAWVGETDPETNRLEPRTWAGIEDGYLDDVTVPVDESATDRGPAWTAIRRRRVAVSQNVQTDAAFEPWREQAVERGFRAAAAIPLSYEDDLYGALLVYAEHPDAFDRAEQDLLAELGDDIAHAIHSLEVQRDLQKERDCRDVLFANNLNPVIEFSFESEVPIVDAVNPAFEDVFGYASADVVGEAIDDTIIPRGEYETHELTKRQVLLGEGSEDEVRRETATGIRDFVRRIIPHTPEEPSDGGYVWYTDITETRERKRELERYETIVEAVGDPVYALDAGGHFTFVNDAFVEEVGYPRSAVIGEHVSKFVPEAHRNRGREVVRELLADDDRRSATWELERITADGDPVPVENHVALLPMDEGEFRGTAGVFRDISERKRREQRLKSITEATSKDAIYIKDTDGRYRFINEVGADVFGREPEEVIGERAAELYESVETERLEVDQRVIDTEEPVEYEVTRTTRGEQRHFLAEKTPYYENGELFGLVGISRDITERKEYERELKRQNERLDEFASVVAHDIRNPLNAAQGRLELARTECDSDHFAHVARAHDRMEELISDLLTLARDGRTVTETEPVDLASVAEQCWWTVETPRVELRVDTALTIRADPSRLRQLLENLFDNAITHGGEDVTVTVGELADEAGFYVADDGEGIPPAERETVFDLGHSPTENGTGFGLSIVEGIAEAHGWEVGVTESADGGTRFEISAVDVE